MAFPGIDDIVTNILNSFSSRILALGQGMLDRAMEHLVKIQQVSFNQPEFWSGYNLAAGIGVALAAPVAFLLVIVNMAKRDPRQALWSLSNTLWATLYVVFAPVIYFTALDFSVQLSKAIADTNLSQQKPAISTLAPLDWLSSIIFGLIAYGIGGILELEQYVISFMGHLFLVLSAVFIAFILTTGRLRHWLDTILGLLIVSLLALPVILLWLSLANWALKSLGPNVPSSIIGGIIGLMAMAVAAFIPFWLFSGTRKKVTAHISGGKVEVVSKGGRTESKGHPLVAAAAGSAAALYIEGKINHHGEERKAQATDGRPADTTKAERSRLLIAGALKGGATKAAQTGGSPLTSAAIAVFGGAVAPKPPTAKPVKERDSGSGNSSAT